MLGIEFPELIVIAVVALIVIGPEHLPKVARTIGHLWGRAQRYINGIKADMSRDMALEELRELQKKTQQEVAGVEQSIAKAAQEWDQQVREFEGEVAKPGQGIAAQEIPGQEMAKPEIAKPETIRHEIIEEHHAVLPAVAEQNKTPNT